jgi:hypothetical protein
MMRRQTWACHTLDDPEDVVDVVVMGAVVDE